MSRFAMGCPICGKYTEAKRGLFAKKKLNGANDIIIRI